MCLKRIYKTRKAIEKTVADEERDLWYDATPGIQAKADKCKSQAFVNAWWKTVEQLLSIFMPIYKFFRLVDADTPRMGEVSNCSDGIALYSACACEFQ